MTPRIVGLYELQAITARTRLLMICHHLVNITGQILPVREICRAMARARASP